MRISVVIPCFEQQAALDRTLHTLLAQTTPPHEIIVVDDGSAQPIAVPEGVWLLRIDREAAYRGSSDAKNRGAKAAVGDYLLFSDADILHMPDAIECLGRATEPNTLHNVISIPVHESAAREYQHDPVRLSEYLRCREDIGLVKSGALVSSEQHAGLISRELFTRIGGYDAETFATWGFNNQDLCLRVLKAGGNVSSAVTHADGSLLCCFHCYENATHDSAAARAVFRTKYGRDYSPMMLSETTNAPA